MSVHVFIDGEAGTTGLRIRGMLNNRRDVEVISLPEELRKDVSARRDAMNKSDVVFLCLPDDAAREAVPLVENEKTKIIDASTAHRTEKGWAYGFPELSLRHRVGVAENRLIANPGCYATGFLSIVYPLIAAEIASPGYPFACHAISGYTGAGKKGIAEYEAENRDSLLDAPRAYALGQEHKHLKEMVHVAGLTRTPLFCPTIADFDCGMSVSVPLFTDCLKKAVTPEELLKFYKGYYKACRNIHVTDQSENGYLSANRWKNTNELEIFVGGNNERIYLCARFDNLGKGASGAAIQNMNIALELDEFEGL